MGITIMSRFDLLTSCIIIKCYALTNTSNAQLFLVDYIFPVVGVFRSFHMKMSLYMQNPQTCINTSVNNTIYRILYSVLSISVYLLVLILSLSILPFAQLCFAQLYLSVIIETLIVWQSSSFLHMYLLLQTQGTIHVRTRWYGTPVGDLDLSLTFARSPSTTQTNIDSSIMSLATITRSSMIVTDVREGRFLKKILCDKANFGSCGKSWLLNLKEHRERFNDIQKCCKNPTNLTQIVFQKPYLLDKFQVVELIDPCFGWTYSINPSCSKLTMIANYSQSINIKLLIT